MLRIDRRSQSPHDSFLKGILKDSENVRDLLRCALPREVYNILQPREVHLEAGSYVDESLSKLYSDLLFSCRFKNGPGMLYFLVEHQTKTDHWMALRTTDYSIEILKDWIKAHPRERLLPMVVPVVVYQGRSR
jgi:predicted transposase/invertase (TIGR01784 family)